MKRFSPLNVYSRLAACCAAVALVLPGALTHARAQVPVPVPAPSTPGIASDINVLVLALDDADLQAVRPSNLTDLPAPRALPPGAAIPGAAPIAPPLPELPIAPVGNAFQTPLPRAAAQATPTIPGLPPLSGDERETELELPNRRSPGRAQAAAAPLRRALVRLGVRDVLNSPLDGPVVLRSVNSGRLELKVLDRLRFATQQMLDNLNREPGAPAQIQAETMAIRNASRVGMALGYRAVVVLALSPSGEYSLLLVDAAHETGTTFAVEKSGGTNSQSDQSAAESASALIAAQLSRWAPFTVTDRAAQLAARMNAAREAIEKNDLETAKDQLLQAVALDASAVDAYILLGDVLQNSDPVAAASAYQRAAEINTRNGEVWARIAIVHTLSSPPDWVRSLAAAAKAQTLGYDSANLRTAMAAAEFGRADLFRRNGRSDQAEDAELIARRHLERAREMAPDDPEVVAGVSRLMAKYLLEQKRYSEAVQSLDLLAIQYPNDLQTQLMYAQALEGFGQRSEDLFAAWARVWKLGGDSDIALDATRYARITDGFDQRLFALGKNVFQMTSGVATGALPRETALLQAERSRDEMKATIAALQLMRPPATRTVSDAHNSRQFAADLMQQAAELYLLYLETGSDLNRSRAVEIHRSAIESLNAARLGGQAGL